MSAHTSVTNVSQVHDMDLDNEEWEEVADLLETPKQSTKQLPVVSEKGVTEADMMALMSDDEPQE